MQIMSKGLQGVMRSIHSFDLFSVCTLRSFKEKIGGLEPLGQIVLSLESSWEYWWRGLGSHRLGDRGTELEPVAHREEQGAGKTHIWDMTLKLQRLKRTVQSVIQIFMQTRKFLIKLRANQQYTGQGRGGDWWTSGSFIFIVLGLLSSDIFCLESYVFYIPRYKINPTFLSFFAFLLCLI